MAGVNEGCTRTEQAGRGMQALYSYQAELLLCEGRTVCHGARRIFRLPGSVPRWPWALVLVREQSVLPTNAAKPRNRGKIAASLGRSNAGAKRSHTP